MLTFSVAELLDKPDLSLSTFFPTSRDATAEELRARRFTIYVVREGEEVFYVGKSESDCFERLRVHLGKAFRGHRMKMSDLGQLIVDNLPDSRRWIVELYTNEDTKAVIPKHHYESFVIWPTAYAESAMIQTLKPYMNDKMKLEARELPSRYLK